MRGVMVVAVVALAVPISYAVAASKSSTAPTRAADNQTVLFLASSLDPSDGPTFATSIEVQEAVTNGYSVEIDSDVQWAAKSAADFATYRAIVIGDAQDGSSDPMPALLGNLSKWTSAVRGNEFLTGADSEYHARFGVNTPPSNPALSIRRGVDYAAASGITGLYFAFGGYNTSDIQSVLDALGSGFSVRGGGADSVHVVANVPALADLTDAVLTGWASTYHQTMTAIPNGFTVFATQTVNPSDFAFVIRQVSLDDQLDALRAEVTGVGDKNLGKQVKKVASYIDAGNTAIACKELNSFIKQINALAKNKKFDVAKAATIIDLTRDIQITLGC